MVTNQFSYLLLRSGGDTFQKLRDLVLQETFIKIQSLWKQEEELSFFRKDICEGLFSYIGITEDYALKKNAIDIRREVFNDRRLSNRHFEKISTLPTLIGEQLKNYQILMDKASEQNAVIKNLFYKESGEVQTLFSTAINNDNFLSGLILASNDLLSSAEKYLCSENVGSTKMRQVELGLMKYFSRMVTKTSPFSRFTNISFVKSGPVGEVMDSPPSQRESFIRLNNYTLKYLKTLLIRYRPFYINSGLKLNISIKKDDQTGKLNYLVNAHNSEAFNEIDYSSLTELLLDVFSENKDITFGGLLDLLYENIDADKRSIEDFILRTIELGIVEFNFEVNPKDVNWLANLAVYVKKMGAEDMTMQQLATSLEKLEVEVTNYSGSVEYITRRNCLNAIHKGFYDIYLSLHKDCGLPNWERQIMADIAEGNKITQKNKDLSRSNSKKDNDKELLMTESTLFYLNKERIIYEDTVLHKKMVFPESVASRLNELLTRLNQCMDIMPAFHDIKFKYQLFFKKSYGEDGQVTLLEFYDRYNRMEKSGELGALFQGNEKQSWDNAISSKWSEKLFELFSSKDIDDNNSIDISSRELMDVRNAIRTENTRQERSLSYSAFVQVTAEQGKIGENSLFVLNSPPTHGYGKFFSRFLYYAPAKILKHVINDNKLLAGDEMFCEGNDNSYFNANIHPQLTEYELSTPGAHNRLSWEKQIDISKINIKYDKGSGELYANNSITGQNILFLDLDFQDFSTRSPLFRLLYNFSVKQPPNYFIFFNWVDSYVKSEINGVKVSPRITLDQKLVIRRKSWTILNSSFPDLTSAADECEVFLKIKKWQILLGLPNEFFISTIPSEDQILSGIRDGIKPQYINLENPILVRLVVKSFLKKDVVSAVRAVEFLPSGDQMIEIDGEKVVSEWIVQWTEGVEKRSEKHGSAHEMVSS